MRDTDHSQRSLRWQPASWRDPRLIIGLTLVIASVVGVVGLVHATTQTQSYVVATRDLVPGTTLEEKDITEAEVRLTTPGEHYVKGEQPVVGRVMTDFVPQGELVTRRSLTTQADSDMRPLSLPVEGVLPAGVRPGGGVDVYVTESPDEPQNGEATASRLALKGVRVVKIDTSQQSFGSTDSHVLEVMVPKDQVATMVGYSAHQATMSVVAAPVATGDSSLDASEKK